MPVFWFLVSLVQPLFMGKFPFFVLPFPYFPDYKHQTEPEHF